MVHVPILFTFVLLSVFVAYLFIVSAVSYLKTESHTLICKVRARFSRKCALRTNGFAGHSVEKVSEEVQGKEQRRGRASEDV